MKKTCGVFVLGVLLVASSFVGCSNKPSKEQMQQLNNLKAEVSSLEKEVSAREAEKAALLRSISEKQEQLAQCTEDTQALQSRIQK
ncbi:MAG: hypothetical protein KBG83_00480 [Bacteroidetes bacterium]|nr:hypothetical protein [Bacteroidota bacterium]